MAFYVFINHLKNQKRKRETIADLRVLRITLENERTFPNSLSRKSEIHDILLVWKVPRFKKETSKSKIGSVDINSTRFTWFNKVLLIFTRDESVLYHER